MRKFLSTGYLVGLGVLLQAHALAASFDCAKASSVVETTICASPTLSKLDEQLAATYAEDLSDHKAPDLLRASQRAWIKDTRNACADEGCLIAAYRQRIAALASEVGLEKPVAIAADSASAQTDSATAAALAASSANGAASVASEAGKQSMPSTAAPASGIASVVPAEAEQMSSSSKQGGGLRWAQSGAEGVASMIGLALSAVLAWRWQRKKGASIVDGGILQFGFGLTWKFLVLGWVTLIAVFAILSPPSSAPQAKRAADDMTWNRLSAEQQNTACLVFGAAAVQMAQAKSAGRPTAEVRNQMNANPAWTQMPGVARAYVNNLLTYMEGEAGTVGFYQRSPDLFARSMVLACLGR